MKSYINPEMKISMFISENLITTSGNGETTPVVTTDAQAQDYFAEGTSLGSVSADKIVKFTL